MRLGGARGQQMGDPVGQHAGLARARAGEHEQRPLAVDDGLALGLVEPLQELVELGLDGLGHGPSKLPASPA